LKYLTQKRGKKRASAERGSATAAEDTTGENGGGGSATDAYATWSVKQLKVAMVERGIPTAGCVEKRDLVLKLQGGAAQGAEQEQAEQGNHGAWLVGGSGSDEDGVGVGRAVLVDKAKACRATERYTYYHGRLADYFESCKDLQRRAEELPYHLEKVLDNSRLLHAILEWETFQRLSLQQGSRAVDLLRYCRSVGGYAVVAELMAKQLIRWGGRRAGADAGAGGGAAGGAEGAAGGAGVGADDTLEWLERVCIVANFLTEAGESEHATAMLLDAIQVADDQALGHGPGSNTIAMASCEAMLVIVAAALDSAKTRTEVVAEVAAKVGVGMSSSAAAEAVRLLKLVAGLHLALAEALTMETIFKEHREHESAIIPALEKAIELWRWLGEGDADSGGMGQALTTLCYWLRVEGLDEEAEAAGTEAIEVFSSIGNPRLAQVRNN
jgi:hypothetical protein